jgi:hypothetical protein
VPSRTQYSKLGHAQLRRWISSDLACSGCIRCSFRRSQLALDPINRTTRRSEKAAVGPRFARQAEDNAIALDFQRFPGIYSILSGKMELAAIPCRWLLPEASQTSRHFQSLRNGRRRSHSSSAASSGTKCPQPGMMCESRLVTSRLMLSAASPARPRPAPPATLNTGRVGLPSRSIFV